MTIRSAKSATRSDALRRRASVDASLPSAFGAALAVLGPDLARRSANRDRAAVSIFLPIRDEPDTLPLIAALAGSGLRTALPATPPRGEPLRFRAWGLGDATVPGRFGTVEPAPDAPELDPDVLFVPLAAFDRRGYRLGYGAGYYDGALRRLRRLKPIVAVGVAFAVQEVDAVPTEPHDERLDAVVTEHGLVTFGST